MGKRVKKKAQNALKEKRVPTSSMKDGLKENNHISKNFNDGVVVVKEKKVCAHFEKAVDVAKVCSKLGSAESTGCEDCREGMIDRKGGKGKGKHGKKKSGSKATWICLQCGHFSCGGVGLPTAEQTHAARHSSQNRHPLVIQLENNKLRWCFSCRAFLPVQTFDDNDELKDALSDIVTVLKNQSYKTTSGDVEDMPFGSGSIISDVKSENKVVSLPNSKDLFAIRGLVNLGNTCFFNSVMQNLLAIDILREYLLSFDGLIGPMTSALKKIYIETSLESGLRNVINPKPLFGCICAKASQFRGFQQQDSHELLRCLLDGLSAEDLRAKKSDVHSREYGPSLPASPTFIDVIFGGQISSTVCCVECGHSSVVHEPFLDLSLPLPTKKPHPKKALPASRTRKGKQPPKRVGRPRPKLGKDGNLCSTVIGCDPSSSSQSSSADLVEPVLVVDNKGLGSQEHNFTKPDDACAQVPESGGQEVDGVRLDCPEPVTQSDAQEADFSWLDFIEPVTESDSPESDSWPNFLEPVSLLDDQNLTVESNDVLDSVESGSKDGNHNINSIQETTNSSEQIGVDTGDKNMKPQSVVNGWEDDCLRQVKDNEVLLLPYKEDCPSTEIPSLAVGDEEDTSDFVGFGDMFDEPEAVATTSEVSNNLEGNSHLGNGFLAGNSTESDPDEVDNTDSQVSVESCLAHFVKPELLSGEHAWHCENCSKLQLKERRKLKKNHLSLVHQKNVSKNELSGTSSVFVADSNGSTGSHENSKNHIPVQAYGSTPVLSKELGEINEAESACSDATSVSICPQLPDETSLGSKSINCCTVYADHVPVETLSGSEEHDSEEDEDIDSKSVKVMRSATKRILISKSPAILTIHLKRFGQDARGRLSKLSGHVVFKEFIDLRPYLDNRSVGDNCIYRLIGVVEHSGSMRGGHYVAYVRGTNTRRGRSDEENHTQKHNVWYHASDAYVRETTLNEVLHSEAYILFYERVQL